MEILLSKKQSLLNQRKKQTSGARVTTITFVKDQKNVELDIYFQQRCVGRINPKNSFKDRQYSQQIPLPKRKYHKCHNKAKVSQMFFVKSINLLNKPKQVKDKENNGKIFQENQFVKTSNFVDRDKKTLQPLSINKIHNTALKDRKKHLYRLQLNQIPRTSLFQRDKISKLKQRHNTIINLQDNLSSNIVKFQQLNNKDPIFQNKLIRYWAQIQKIADLNKFQVAMNEGKTIKYFIGKGNNSQLLKQIMKKRWWWTYSQDKNSSDIYLVWSQLKDKLFYSNCKFHSKSTDTYSEQSIMTESTNSQRINAIKIDTNKVLPNSIVTKKYKKLKLTTYHNHYEHNEFLGNKKALFYNMRAYYKSINQNPFDYLPLTFHIASLQDEQFKQFTSYFQSQLQKNKRKRLWIVKPGQNSNRGKGITLHTQLQDIISLIGSSQSNKQQPQRTFIIQQYIQKPFLYNKRKFDIRCYILLTCINGQIKGYWYKDGYIRTSCYEFSLNFNSFVHLTNDAIQKNCEQYGKFQQGNKLSFQIFKRYLNYKYQKKYDFDEVYEKIRKIAIDSIKASYYLLSGKIEHSVFEIFGLDFMIDENFQPWLIEVNTNPCLETSCPILQKIIPKMLEDAFRLSLDPVFPPPEQWPQSKRHFLSNATNNFQLVFEEEKQSVRIRKNDIEKIGQIEQDDEIYEEQEEKVIQ